MTMRGFREWEWDERKYFFNYGLEVLGFLGGGAGFRAERGEVGEDFVVGKSG